MTRLVTNTAAAHDLPEALQWAREHNALAPPGLALLESRRGWAFALIDTTGSATAPRPFADALTEAFEARIAVDDGELRWNQQTATVAWHHLASDDPAGDGIAVVAKPRQYLLRGTLTEQSDGWSRSDGGPGAAFVVPGRFNGNVWLTTHLCVAEPSDVNEAVAGNAEIVDELLAGLTSRPSD